MTAYSLRRSTAPASETRINLRRIAATVRFMVKRVKNGGSISRARPTRDTWLRDALAAVSGAAWQLLAGCFRLCAQGLPARFQLELYAKTVETRTTRDMQQLLAWVRSMSAPGPQA